MGGVVLGQGPVEGDGFLGGGQCVLVTANPRQRGAEVGQCFGEVCLMGGGVVLGQGPVQGHGFPDGRQRVLVATGIRQRGA